MQEAKAKWPALREAAPDAALHLIGPLQTNKARDAVALFDTIETVDRPKLAAALAREMDRTGRRPACLVEGQHPAKNPRKPASSRPGRTSSSPPAATNTDCRWRG